MPKPKDLTTAHQKLKVRKPRVKREQSWHPKKEAKPSTRKSATTYRPFLDRTDNSRVIEGKNKPVRMGMRFLYNPNWTPEENKKFQEGVTERVREKVPSHNDNVKSPIQTSKKKKNPATPVKIKDEKDIQTVDAPEQTPEKKKITPQDLSLYLTSPGGDIYSLAMVTNLLAIYDNRLTPKKIAPEPIPESNDKIEKIRKKLDFGTDAIPTPEPAAKKQKLSSATEIKAPANNAADAVVEADSRVKKSSQFVTSSSTRDVKRKLRDNAGRRAITQSQAMARANANPKDASATKYAHATLPVHIHGQIDKSRKYEWSHLIPHSKAGMASQKAHNLMCATREMNTCMMFVENVLNHLDKDYPDGYLLEVEADLLYEEKNGTWKYTHNLCGKIQWKVTTKDFDDAIISLDTEHSYDFSERKKPHRDYQHYVEAEFFGLIEICKQKKAKSLQPLQPPSTPALKP